MNTDILFLKLKIENALLQSGFRRSTDISQLILMETDLFC